MSNGSESVVDDVKQAKAALSNIDWSFHPGPALSETELKPFNARKYHWYPATFVPEIPFTLIEILTSPGATVYDPFSGIGTTYFQALSLNRKPIGTDICKVAVDYTENLSTLFDPDCDHQKVLHSLEEKFDEYSDGVDYSTEVSDEILLDELRPWYSEPDFQKFCFLFQLEAANENRFEKAALRIAISDALKSHCSQNRGWGCVADNMHPKEEQIMDKRALSGVSSKLQVLLRDIDDHLATAGDYYDEIYSSIRDSQTIFHTDVREFTDIVDESVDLVVTSPPYPEMTDYVAAQRLSYYWLGEKVGLSDRFNNDMNTEIGARRKRSRGSSNREYLEMMYEANENIVSKVAEGGYLCYVLPEIDDDEDERKEIVSKVLTDIENRNEMSRIEDYMRVIPSNRRSHNIKWTSLNQERISLFRKNDES
ncbi:DNA methyltransferase [Natrarchaeobius sp. A-rgal3]|uniref:DNA methyltransferase n=1 Tax=Natrarchaeobius versutus TaxID=1679078 RepID=UPI00350EF9B6